MEDFAMQTILSTNLIPSSGKKVIALETYMQFIIVYVNDIVIEEVKRIIKESEITKYVISCIKNVLLERTTQSGLNLIR